MASVTQVRILGPDMPYDEVGRRGYERTYRVTLDSVDQDMFKTAKNAAEIPALGSAHPTDAGVYVKRRTPRLVDNHRLMVDVAVQYESRSAAFRDDNPLQDAVRVSWGAWINVEPFLVDENGKYAVNSAGYPFDPPPEEEVSFGKVVITRNEATFNPARVVTYRNTVNQSAITICDVDIPAQAALMKELTADNAERNGTRYWQVRYEIHLCNPNSVQRPDWRLRVLNQGFYNASGERLTDDDGNVMESPALLDASGAKTTTPSYETFVLRRLKNWSLLGLPETV